MTRKDYKIIADALREAEPQTDLALRIAIFKIADHLKVDNPNFKHEAFYKACGLADGQYKRIES